MSHDHRFDPEPPQAPTFKRKLRFYFYQYLGLPLLLLIPVLAIFGVFDQALTRQEQTGDEVSISIDYPSHYRYERAGTIRIHVQNNREESIPLLSIEISKVYLEHFRELHFVPDVSHMNLESYIIELTEILPGTSQGIRIDLQANDYGVHTGFILATVEGIELLRFSMNSFTFP
jgi:hypothetical protein